MTRRLLLLALLAAAGGVAAGFLGFLHTAFDTLAHFRLHGSAAIVAGAPLLAFRRPRWPAALFLIAGLAGIVASATGLRYPSGQALATGQKVYRALHMNLYYDNSAPERFIALVRETRPDMVAVTEVTQAWLRRLEGLSDMLPHMRRCTEWGKFGGTMILSRFAIAGQECGVRGTLSLVRMEIDGNALTFGEAHLRWPWPASGPRQIEANAPLLAQIGPTALVAGDFNATTWSDQLARFASHGGLKIHGGIGPTWIADPMPASLARWIGLPIDNVLWKGRVRIVSARTLAPAGSDHLPVLVEFGFDDSDCCRN